MYSAFSKLALGLVVVASASAYAEAGISDRTRGAGDSVDSDEFQAMELPSKKFDGCAYVVDRTSGRISIKRADGREISLIQDDSGRPVAVISAGAVITLEYESNSSNSGPARARMPDGSERSFQRPLSEVLRNRSNHAHLEIDRVASHVCNRSGRPKSILLDESELALAMTPEFWELELSADWSSAMDAYWWDLSSQPPGLPRCSVIIQQCKEQADDFRDNMTVACILYGIVFTDIAGNLVGGLVTMACEAANLIARYNARSSCETPRVPCQP